MNDSSNPFGFGKMVPGFDFLQNLAKGASESVPQMPSLSKWIAPTLKVEELDKRIQELKSVQFWLEQNATALKATIQALEVQKMTLNTLKGMNFNMAEVANAFTLKPESMFGAGQNPTGGAAEKASAAATAAEAAVEQSRARQKKEASTPAQQPSAAAQPPAAPAQPEVKAPATAGGGVVDPMQWWGSLTQQFQQIAAGAMKDAARQTPIDAVKDLAAGFTQGTAKSGMGLARAATEAKRPGGAAKKAGARKRAG